MNGRLYDPAVGAFLSPDPYVQEPDLTLSYNRYSYCLNNPLKYTDPGGYTWGIFKPFVKAAKWVGNNISSVATVVYLAAAVAVTVICPPAGLAMLGAYIGGAQANGWELNAGAWNWKDFSTYAGIVIGGLTGYVAGYGLVHPGTVGVRFGAAAAGIGEIGISMSNNNWDLSWSTVAGGGGSYNLNGRNTTPEQIVDRAMTEATNGWAVTAATGYMGALQLDVFTPDPSDALWPKWAGHVVLGTASALVLGKNFADYFAEHKSGARNSTKGKHEDGQARKSRDYGGEKGDVRRNPPRQKPPKWKGPWPPKNEY